MMKDQLFGRHARRSARRAQPERERRRSSTRRRRSRAVPDAADEGRGDARRRSSPSDGVAARPRRARDRAAARRRFGFTATELARAKQAMMAQLRARHARESRPRVGQPRRRIHAELSRGRSAADHLAGAGVPSALPAGHHAGRGQRAGRATGFPTATAWSSSPRPTGRRRRCPTEAAARGGREDARRPSGLTAYVDTAAQRRSMDDAADARLDRQDDRRTRRPASRSGRCRTARRSCSKPTKLKEDQILFRAFAPGGTSLASDADFIPPASPTRSCRPAASARFSAVTLDKILDGKARRRHAVHRRNRRGHGRRQHAAGSRDDVPAAVPAIHRSRAPTRRRSRRWRRRPGRCSRTRWRARTSCSSRPSTPRSARTTRGGSPRRRPRSTSGTWHEVAGVLQGALRRREQLHVRLRRQLHARRDQAARRDVRRAACPPRTRTRRGGTSASRRPTGVVEQDGPEGHRAEERGGDRLFRAVRVRRRAPAGAADDDAAAAVAAARHDPAGARRHLQHHGHARDARSSRGRSTPCGSTGRAIRPAPTRSCSASSRRSSR